MPAYELCFLQRSGLHRIHVLSLLLQAFTDHAPASASSASLVSTANTGRLAAGLLGLFAVPVVAWSEYTLRTTGMLKANLLQFHHHCFCICLMFCKAWHTTEFAVAHHTDLLIGFRLYDAETARLVIKLRQYLSARIHTLMCRRSACTLSTQLQTPTSHYPSNFLCNLLTKFRHICLESQSAGTVSI